MSLIGLEQLSSRLRSTLRSSTPVTSPTIRTQLSTSPHARSRSEIDSLQNEEGHNLILWDKWEDEEDDDPDFRLGGDLNEDGLVWPEESVLPLLQTPVLGERLCRIRL